MARQYRHVIYIDRDPTDPYKGWGWVEVDVEKAKRHGVPTGYPETYTRLRRTPGAGSKLPNNGNLPSRGKAGTKKFSLSFDGNIIEIRAQKSLTITAVCAWVKTWAPSDAQLITPGGRTHTLDGQKIAHQAYFVYFILNPDSNAIKIGLAKDLSKRLKALQTASPAPLKLLKSLQVEGAKEAEVLERSLHKRFSEIRLSGEWFKAENQLWDYLDRLQTD